MTVRTLNGDCRAILPTLAAEAFDCIVTSPPYWGLRDYGVDGQIGLERTLDGYVEAMAAVGRELWRVLKPEGTFWLNIGDSYSSTTKGTGGGGTSSGLMRDGRDERGRASKFDAVARQQHAAIKISSGLKPKDLCMVPARVALRLQEPWYGGKIKSLADRVWLAAMIDGEGCMYVHKRKSGTPAYSDFQRKDGSVASYSRTSDSYAAGLEIANTSEAIINRVVAIVGRGSVSTQGPEQNGRRRKTIYRWNLRSNECKELIREIYPHLVGKQHEARVLIGCPSSGVDADKSHRALIALHNGARAEIDFPAPESHYSKGWFLRSEIVWSKPNPMPESVTDRPTSSHERVFLLTKSERYFYDAAAIAERAVDPGVRVSTAYGNAGTGKGSTTAYGENAKETRNARNVWTIASQPYSGAHFATMPPALVERCLLAGCPGGGHALDPFGGAGTTGLVADRLGRDATLIELNPDYVGLQRSRIAGDAPLFAEVV